MNSIYKSIEIAKNGTKIPVFLSGKTMESRYNPQRDAENLLSTVTAEQSFFIIAGIGSGIFIKLLSNKFPKTKIIALENSKEDIDFLMQLENVKLLCDKQNVILCSIENLFDTIIQNYLPAKFGAIKIIEQKAWILENQNQTEIISKKINKAIGIVSADYSVQAHFGKLWLRNIMENTVCAEHSICNFPELSENELSKTAVIAAAGPSLDSFINSISIEQRKNYYFISTDTAYSSLIKQNIIPEFCVSIDGQNVSYNHFLHKTKDLKTIFAFDLCANSVSAKKIYKDNNKLMFFCSGHPLATAINNYGNHFLPELFSGSGTVTITALDLAIKLGFTKIIIAGADFSYSNGKTYTSGTYLDKLYNKSSCKLQSAEKTFASLMYRTALTKVSDTRYTTQILQAYQTSLENYLSDKHITFNKKDGIYNLLSAQSQKLNFQNKDKMSFSIKNFLNSMKKASPYEVEMLLLPYIAYLRQKKKYQNADYEELVQLAFTTIVSYNI